MAVLGYVRYKWTVCQLCSSFTWMAWSNIIGLMEIEGIFWVWSITESMSIGTRGNCEEPIWDSATNLFPTGWKCEVMFSYWCWTIQWRECNYRCISSREPDKWFWNSVANTERVCDTGWESFYPLALSAVQPNPVFFLPHLAVTLQLVLLMFHRWLLGYPVVYFFVEENASRAGRCVAGGAVQLHQVLVSRFVQLFFLCS